MKKKFLSIFIASLVTISMVAGCGNQNAAGNEDTESNTQDAAETQETEESTTDEAEDTQETEESITEESDSTSTVEEGELMVTEGDPDFTQLTVEEWMNYEFNKDYATVFSDIVSYSHEDSRKLLDTHWQSYMAITPYLMDPEGDMTEEDARNILTAWHNARESIEPETNVEDNRIYLWEDGKVPTITEYTENTGYQYADNPDFQPYMMEVLVDEGTEIKGAVVINAGGGHMYRSNVEEAYESALALNERGYQCFIVNYRVNPYTDEESALDIARAVRIIRSNAEKYGIDENSIAAAGFSYGGIVASLAADSFAGDVNASTLVADYTPDEIDSVSADINSYIAIYSVVPDEVTNTNFPASFFAYGGADPTLWDWGYTSYQTLREMNIPVEIHTFSGVPHGFGAGTHADGTLYENAATWPLLADIFMQNVYAGTAAAPVQETQQAQE